MFKLNIKHNPTWHYPSHYSETRQGRRFSLMNRVNLFVTVGTGRFITLTYFVTGGFILATLFTQLSIHYYINRLLNIYGNTFFIFFLFFFSCDTNLICYLYYHSFGTGGTIICYKII